MFGTANKFRGVQSFNMTPIIDIVFLLIIFFMVVCQFIESENFPVTVPDNCDFARESEDLQKGLTTVTVMKSADGRSHFAVGSEKISAAESSEVINKMAGLIDERLKDLPTDRRIVNLRIDSGSPYSDAQYALAGIAASSAVDIQLAVLKERQAESGVQRSE